MNMNAQRRQLLGWLAAAPLGLTLPAWAVNDSPLMASRQELARLEKSFSGSIGVYLLDPHTRRHFSYQGEKRFAFCSTFKALLGAAILHKSSQDGDLLEREITLNSSDFVTYSPVTEKHKDGSMRIADLCAATIQTSDNTAANALLRELGGPAALTAYMRSIGDNAFRLDRWETELNSALPGDLRDTSTPSAMANSLHKLVLGNALAEPQKHMLKEWLIGNTTGNTRIRAGLPQGWLVGDKTGTGDYGSAHDIAVVWPPSRAPFVLAIYTCRKKKDSEARSDIIAEVTRVLVQQWLLKQG
ncbi:class A beta-lactamase [Undibacterium crateris]|uniref:class A beta-lactamase n=1 Tax=Undibacterium crateris TaxID=2528175 RepID=UPI00138A0276|nr:class A beta-lactamase [Undibacterium crateris]NDI85734.1 class A beta-lactamase [Undibacterium crateris]